MAYCRKCGAELKNQSAFCTVCGAPALPEPASPAASPSAKVPLPTAAPDERITGRRPSRALLVLIVGLAVLAVGIGGVLLVRSSSGEAPAASDTPAGSPTSGGDATPSPAAGTPEAASSPSAAPAEAATDAPPMPVPELTFATRTVTDLPAVERLSYQTVTLAGVPADVSALVNDKLAALTDPDLATWRNFGVEDCTEVGIGAPCGYWEQTATQVPCIAPYLCVLVEGAGVTPGAATSFSTVATLAIDPATGASVTLPDVLGGASKADLMRLVNLRVARFQESEWSIGCDDPQSVGNSPVRARDVSHWLPAKRGIRVWFDKYQVGPGAAGNVMVTVPWADLRNPPTAGESVDPCRRPEPAVEVARSVTVEQESYAVAVLCGNSVSALPDVVPGNAGADATRVVQIVMRLYGYDAGPVDGQYGPQSQRAVRAFQSDRGLTVDAQVGPQTWSAMQQGVCRVG